MVTSRLWAALNHPPSTHPLFQRTVVLPVVKERFYLSWANLIVSLILGLSRYAPTLLLLLMPFILSVMGLIYGIDCALRVSSAITYEREHDTYNLLSLSPPGPFGAMWTLCTSALYRHHDFLRLQDIMRAALLTGLIVSVLVTVILLGIDTGLFARMPQPTIAGFLNFSAILGAVYVEYIYSAVLGILVGMAVSTYTHNRLDASLWAFGVYLLLQTITYVLTLLVGFTLLPAIFDQFQIDGDYAAASLSWLRLGMFLLARETIITAVWRGLLERLNVTAVELDFIHR